ncbi:hypothetical protein E2C01_093492 [Portunus trituberculatus]|uniref:Uncharacterized protein n=1 Tax=Portunus trituberculatus TaxID=210409 RepID=A0A5B7JYV3_PORTR|nr:hypothetical protein [Portunus trituberculatus]
MKGLIKVRIILTDPCPDPHFWSPGLLRSQFGRRHSGDDLCFSFTSLFSFPVACTFLDPSPSLLPLSWWGVWGVRGRGLAGEWGAAGITVSVLFIIFLLFSLFVTRLDGGVVG